MTFPYLSFSRPREAHLTRYYYIAVVDCLQLPCNGNGNAHTNCTPLPRRCHCPGCFRAMPLPFHCSLSVAVFGCRGTPCKCSCLRTSGTAAVTTCCMPACCSGQVSPYVREHALHALTFSNRKALQSQHWRSRQHPRPTAWMTPRLHGPTPPLTVLVCLAPNSGNYSAVKQRLSAYARISLSAWLRHKAEA
jgi:hypothetical protein